MNDLGKILPQAIDFENSLLGSLLANQDNIGEVDMLEPKHFYNTKNEIVYSTIMTLYNRNEKIDTLLVSNELKKEKKLEEIGGFQYLAELVKKQTGKNNISKYCEIIIEKYLRRKGIETSGNLLTNFYEDSIDVFETIDKANQEINNISAFASVEEPVDAVKAIKVFEENVNTKTEEEDDGITGIPSGFTYLDKCTSGWQYTDFIVLGGRPGMGKSAKATDFARNSGVPTAIISLEMSAFQVWSRIIARGLKTNSKVFTKMQYKDAALKDIRKEISKYPNIFVDPVVGLSITHLKSKARKLKKEKGLKLLIVDYVQLMTGKIGKDYRGNDNAELNDISKGLKEIAKELNIAVIALSQLSRKVEDRKIPKPKLSDLRGSGGIEQDADVVMFAYRPEYYNIETKIAPRANKSSCKGLGCLIVEKHRGGDLGVFWSKFDKHYSSFSDFIYDTETGEEILLNNNKEEIVEDLPF